MTLQLNSENIKMDWWNLKGSNWKVKLLSNLL